MAKNKVKPPVLPTAAILAADDPTPEEQTRAIVERWNRLQPIAPAKLKASATQAWPEAERRRVLEYMRPGIAIPIQTGAIVLCGLCKDIAGTAGSYTDGVWVWRDSFRHYIQVHGVSPVPEFIAWVACHATYPPESAYWKAQLSSQP